eukprot:CAMPEP_0172778894 /NCGR_PEP_ID=MMETSP1074-20121228/202145_1 /TAXON_ID=2916 /ORGANISM="Ceratium fusus, Strain PA161109" /LENGTH=445 /DNA_ID=CAMNT_0013615847 /DNA_START=102 /DNA_END=1440 /DNA_ORIENTATION=-
MVSAYARAGRGSTRRTYRPKMPKTDPTAAPLAHQDGQTEAPSTKMSQGAMLKSDTNKPEVKPPPGLEFMLHATQVEEEILDQVVPEQVCQASAVKAPPGLESVANNLPATPETTDPSEVQEVISESDDVATVAENPLCPLYVKDVSECAACSGNMLAPSACCVSIEGLPNTILSEPMVLTMLQQAGACTKCLLRVQEGLPNTILSEPMVLTMLQQAGLLGEVITFSTREGDPCGEAHISFSSVDVALRCVYHFEGCQWDASGTEVTAKMAHLESLESGEFLNYALGMVLPMEGGEHVGELIQEQPCETRQEHLGAMAHEQACEVLQEHAGAMMSADAAEFVPCDTEPQQPPGVLRADAPAFEAIQNDSMVNETLIPDFVPCDTESQQPPAVLRADAPAFEAIPNNSMVNEALIPEVYGMVDVEACDFMTVHGWDFMAAFVGEGLE